MDGAPADPVQRRLCQQPVPGAAAVLPLARRGGAAAGPDDPAARPQGERQAGACVFTSEELSALGKTCQGRSFAQRRDTAIIAVLTATGIRAGELAGIRYDPDDPRRSDLDLCGGRSPCAARAA